MAEFKKKLRLAYEANQNLEEEIKQYKAAQPLHVSSRSKCTSTVTSVGKHGRWWR